MQELNDTKLIDVNGGGLIALVKAMIGWDAMVKAYNDGYAAGQY